LHEQFLGRDDHQMFRVRLLREHHAQIGPDAGRLACRNGDDGSAKC
jgi:hypothetical protein